MHSPNVLEWLWVRSSILLFSFSFFCMSSSHFDSLNYQLINGFTHKIDLGNFPSIHEPVIFENKEIRSEVHVLNLVLCNKHIAHRAMLPIKTRMKFTTKLENLIFFMRQLRWWFRGERKKGKLNGKASRVHRKFVRKKVSRDQGQSF